MRPRLLSGAVVVAVLAVVGTAVPSQAGPPGKWTVISGGGVSSIYEPGMYRTGDGVVHVAIPREADSLDSLDVAHVSASGQLEGRQVVLDSWSGLTEDPDLVTDAGDGVQGATVKAKWNGNKLTCKTAANGKCKITFPKMGKNKIKVSATKAGYAPDETKLKVN